MNNKRIFLIGIVLILAIVGASFLYLNFIFYVNPKHSLNYSAMIEDIPHVHIYRLRVVIMQNETLYNCKIEVNYLATNGTWYSKTENLGIVDVDESVIKNIALEDFQPESNGSPLSGIAWPLENVTNVRVEAYGYSKP